jgi:hypothetical protein
MTGVNWRIFNLAYRQAGTKSTKVGNTENTRVLKRTFFVLVFLLVGQTVVYSWGFWAHKRINRMAVFTLPPDLFGFYKKHIDHISEHAVDADMRRFTSPDEACRHFIDLDRYGEYPFDSIPKKWKDAVAKYGEDSLREHGIVPWHIATVYYWLVDAFKREDVDAILRLSADLGHYVGDAHVPLHTTRNYDGQLTGQRGIHAFWESRLPELFGEEYDFMVGKAKYIDDPLAAAWNAVLESHQLLDSVLLLEKELSQKFPQDMRYSFEQKGGKVMRVYSAEYSAEYNKALQGMVERRMKKAVYMLGCLWMSAWVDAGQPDLLNLPETVEQPVRAQPEEESRWLGRPEE